MPKTYFIGLLVQTSKSPLNVIHSQSNFCLTLREKEIVIYLTKAMHIQYIWPANRVIFTLIRSV